ncbi:MAG: Gmad2 immunoglobulin-like domain-containing protein [Acidimicrobiales bacterium]
MNSDHRRTRFAVLALAGAVAAIVVGVVVSRSDDGKVAVTPVASTTSAGPTTSTIPVSPSSTTPAGPLANAIFPFARDGRRYEAPELAAQSFATDFLGMPDASVDASTPTADDQVRTVRVHTYGVGHPQLTVTATQAAAGDWVVTAAQSDTITVESATGSPLRVSGTSTAFEAQIRIELRSLATGEVVASTTTMGGSNGEIGPYATMLPTPTGPGPYALVVLDGDASGRAATASATVLRVDR